MAQKTLRMIQSPSGHVRTTRKPLKGDKATQKLELKKYDPNIRKHAVYKEIKKLRSIKKKDS